jgi:membrane protein DedA with SNARE-associated domain
VVIVAVAVVSAIVVSSLRVVQVAFDSLDIFAVLTLFLVNWLGNGGVLVPIPGARFIGLLMVFQQAVILPSWEVFLVAGAAIGLGQLSYYVAGARTAESYAAGDQAGAEKIAADTGMSDDAREFAPGAELDADIVSTLAGVDPSDSAGADSGSAVSSDAPQRGWRARFSTSLKRTQDRARPVLEQRGAWGMFLLCFAPTPMGTAAAYLGGLMEFGFRRYLISSFGAKFLLTGVIVMLGLVFSDAARAVQLPEIELPQIDWPEFDFRLFELPDFAPDETPGSSPDAAVTNAPSS